MRWCLLLGLHTLLLTAARAQQTPRLFPFQISYDSPRNVTNVSEWLDPPAGREGRVFSHRGGFHSGTGPLRFWGTNLCFEACFPTRDEAEQLAQRLARFGFNCVRMHHMDARHIWGDSGNATEIDRKMLERLDYLIYQLMRRGIHTNLNLHVSRQLGAADGFEETAGRPRYDKGLTNFEPRMIELQKKYARDLLTHVNPYTKLSYANDPAIALVEISNEDALFDVWQHGHLDRLGDPYRTTLRTQWNEFLQHRYQSRERLAAAWNPQQQPAGRQLIQSGDFSGDWKTVWHVDSDERARYSVLVALVQHGDRAGEPGAASHLHFRVERVGKVDWRPQIYQQGFALRRGEKYALEFEARSDTPGKIGVNVMMGHDPWSNLGLWKHEELGATWRKHRITFRANQSDENARLTLTSFSPGNYRFRAVSLRSAAVLGLPGGASWSDGSIPIMERYGKLYTPGVANDWIDFLYETEAEYWPGMYAFLKQELGVQALVSGTQLGYSPPTIQARLDYIDAHAYWKHPHFPGRPWDRSNWAVENVAMASQFPGTLASLAGRQVRGLPFVVSEYNHPQPNQYGAEALPMLAAVAALQGWDGLFLFAYSHDRDYQPDHLSSFFDLKGDPSKLAHAPACAAIMLRGALPRLKSAASVSPLSQDTERTMLYDTRNSWSLNALRVNANKLDLLRRPIFLDLAGDARGERDHTESAAGTEPLGEWTSPGRAVGWAPGSNASPEAGRGEFWVDTPRVKIWTGFLAPSHIEIDAADFLIDVRAALLDWATVSVVARDDQQFGKPGRVLLAATGLVTNSGAKLRNLGGRHVTLGSDWGTAPVLCEGIVGSVHIPLDPQRVKFFALDPSGNRKHRIDASDRSTNKRTVLEIHPKHRTIWYEIEVAQNSSSE